MQERGGYGSRPYMQFPVFGEGEGGGKVGLARARVTRETLNPYIFETARDSANIKKLTAKDWGI